MHGGAAASFLTIFLIVFGVSPARAQEPTAAQYVFLIDDSGSMRPLARDPGADPDRLAVFAARSVLALLDDSDEASIVRLNGPPDEVPAPVRPLRQARGELEALLDNGGPIARYEGRETPCSRAFEAVRSLLNAAHRPNVRQVVVYLTDGACEANHRPDAVDPNAFLNGIESFKDGPENALLFYLLRFRGRTFTRELETIATRTGGTAFELLAGDATGILRPFAQAISRAQGFDALEVSPSSPQVAAHTSARRVRLLAVAAGEGPPIEIRFRGAVQPEALGPPKTGVHRYADARTFRFATLDYRPGVSGVELEVLNGGTDWRIVAIPEYRLHLETTVLNSACGSGGNAVSVLDVGATACVRLRLLNEAGEPVEAAGFGGRVTLNIGYQAPGTDAPRDLPPNPAAGTAIGGTLERARLEPGDHVFRPSASLTLGTGSPFTIYGTAFTLQASSTRILATPSRWAIGPVSPGSRARSEFTVSGNFSSTQAVFDIANREAIPSCVRFTLSSVAENGAIALAAGQRYTMAAEVTGVCGLRRLDQDLSGSVRLTAQGLPPVEVPFTAHLDYRIEFPRTIEVRVRRGGPVHMPIEIGGNSTADLHLSARFAEPPADWPDELAIGFVDEHSDAEARRDAEGKPLREAEIVAARAEGTRSTATVWVNADPCCTEGPRQTELLLNTIGSRGEPVRIPIRLRVDERNFLSCYGGRLLALAATVITLLLLWFLANMRSNTHFISRESLARTLPIAEYHQGHKPEWLRKPPKLKAPSGTKRFIKWMSHHGWLAGFGRPYCEMWTLTPEFAVGSHKQIKQWKASLDTPIRQSALPRIGFTGTPRIVVLSQRRGTNSLCLLVNASLQISFKGHPFSLQLEDRGDVETHPDSKKALVAIQFKRGLELMRTPNGNDSFEPHELESIHT